MFFLVGKARNYVRILHHFCPTCFSIQKKYGNKLFHSKINFRALCSHFIFLKYKIQSSFGNPILDIYFCPNQESKNPFKLIILGKSDFSFSVCWRIDHYAVNLQLIWIQFETIMQPICIASKSNLRPLCSQFVFYMNLIWDHYAADLHRI